MKKSFAFLICFTCILSTYAQLSPDAVLVHARKDIEKLCSEELSGRGYVNEGHLLAAKYVASRFREIGVKPIIKGDGELTYMQPFSFQTNVVTKTEVSVDGRRLEDGVDYIVHSMSGSSKGKYLIDDRGAGMKPKPVNNRVVLMDAGLPPNIMSNKKKRMKYEAFQRPETKMAEWLKAGVGAEGFVFRQEKLTAAFRAEQAPVAAIEIQQDSVGDFASIEWDIQTKLQNIPTQNVVGAIRGKEFPDSVIIISAHYDHLGMQGDAMFPGANDNASGISFMLALAEYFVKHPLNYSLVFIAFGAEEAGLHGSMYYVKENPLIPLEKTKFILNVDLMGNGTEGIMAVGGRDYPRQHEKLVELNEKMKLVPKVKARPNAPNSDHFFFLQHGVPGFFIYTMGGPPHYHDVNDNPQTILLSKFFEIEKLMIAFLEQMSKEATR